MPPPASRPRARQFGLTFGSIPTGVHNAISDVPGVRVGHVTRWIDRPRVSRTGVTSIVPDDVAGLYRRPMAAGMAVLNGTGELTGSLTIRESGVIETPILLTSTHAVGRIYDGVVDAVLAAGAREVVIPVVGECDDSWLDDISTRPIVSADGVAAIGTAAGGPVAEGAIGAGTGMATMGYKGGIGTASRVVPGLGTIGVLLLCNFGDAQLLRVGGVPVGVTLAAELTGVPRPRDRDGSCLGVVATDIALDARQLERVAARVGLGLARVGSVAHQGSGEIFCAISTTNRSERHAAGIGARRLLADGSLDPVFTAVVDASEEAVTNALFVADTVTGAGGTVVPGLPVDRVLELLSGRIVPS